MKIRGPWNHFCVILTYMSQNLIVNAKYKYIIKYSKYYYQFKVQMRPEKYFPQKSNYSQRDRYRKETQSPQTSTSNYAVGSVIEQMQRKYFHHNSSHSYSSQLEQYVLTMNWNQRGQLLSVGMSNQIKVWDMLPQSGLKLLLTKQLTNSQIIGIKFVNDNVFGCLSGSSVRFWDVRQGMNRQISSLYAQIQQQWDLFDINHKNQYITLGGYEGLRNYDFRKIKNNDYLISQSGIDMPLFEIKWFQQGQQVLLAVGGIQNKGILTLYNSKLEELTTLQLGSSPIKSMSLDKKSTTLVVLAQENTALILDMPQVICSNTISIQEQMNLYSCYVNSHGEKIAFLTQQQALVYNLKQGDPQNPLKIPISLNTPICWHPSQDLLTHVSKTQRNTISLTKIKK